MNKKIKIFISTHKPADYIQNSILTPIQVGTALKGHSKIPNILHDNDGDNISDLNLKFCELTAQYWVWKNIDAEYYGFFHYRRYLSFAKKDIGRDNIWGIVDKACINTHTTQELNLEENKIESIVQKYDVILPRQRNIREMPIPGKNMLEQYILSPQLHGKDLKIMRDVIKEKYPNFEKYADQYLYGKNTYFCNMFIMKKEIFNSYCEWLFDILFECEKRIDYTNYSTEATRTIGHLAERLLNIYILYLKAEKQPKIKELQSIQFKNTDPEPDLKPAFKSSNIPIVFAANNDFIPVFATCLQSVIDHSSTKNNYDIILLQSDVSDSNKNKILNMIATKKNFSIRFANADRFVSNYNLKANAHISVETYFRFLIQDVMPEYDKVLYLDCDIIVNADLAELYKINIDDYLLAATKDPDFLGQINGANKDTVQYINTKLKMKNPYNYFQAGVLLLNEKKMRLEHTVDEWLKYASVPRKYNDQDVLNLYCENKVKYLDMSWNMITDHNNERVEKVIKFAPDEIQKEYAVAHSNPKIIHYAGFKKPWLDPREDYAEKFWETAKRTQYYETLLFLAASRAVEFTAKPYKKATTYNYAVKAYQKIIPSGSTADKKIRKILKRNPSE